jgi:hypothetical protein
MSSPKMNSPDKKALHNKGVKVYLLFDTNAFGNSADAAYELDYAYAGIYLSKVDAFEFFANRTVELGEDPVGGTSLEDEFYPNGVLSGDMDVLLEKYGWKIVTDYVPLVSE